MISQNDNISIVIDVYRKGNAWLWVKAGNCPECLFVNEHAHSIEIIDDENYRVLTVVVDLTPPSRHDWMLAKWLNSFSTDGWSCDMVRDIILQDKKANPKATAFEISKNHRCPLFAVVRNYNYLRATGKLDV